MRNYAILIDAGFLKRKLGSQEAPATAKYVTDFVDRLRQNDALRELTLHRIYYYDAPPLTSSVEQPLSTGKMHFATTRQQKTIRRC